jgi:hypothetical protein
MGVVKCGLGVQLSCFCMYECRCRVGSCPQRDTLFRYVSYMRSTMMPDGDNSNGGRRHFCFANVQLTADRQWDMVM